MTYDVGDKVWVRPGAGATKRRYGEILRADASFPDDYEVRVTTSAYTDETWFYGWELQPRSAIEQLGELV